MRAVVRHGDQRLGRRGKLFFQNHKIRRAKADDRSHARAHAGEPLCDRECDGTADAPTDNQNIGNSVDVGRLTERTDEVGKALALFLLIQKIRGRPDDLKNNADGARRAVIARDRERNPFSFSVHAKNDELPRLCLCRDERCLDLHHSDRRIQDFFFYNTIHIDFLLFPARCGGGR